MVIPVIDLFAGPGGLGEGFASLRQGGNPVFEIVLSIEKDPYAHRTLELRTFFRQFSDGGAPEEYYDYVRGRIDRETLFQLFPRQAEIASLRTWCAELGSEQYPDEAIDGRIQSALKHRTPWVLIGGPPCQVYSIVGRARRNADPALATDQRHFLYREYLRIVAVHRPEVFVMENVKGLLSATARGVRIFERILEDLQHPTRALWGTHRNLPEVSYRLFSLVRPAETPQKLRPADFVVRCEEHGVPQARHRIILLGVRSDWARDPGLLKRAEPVTTQQAIGDLPPLRSGLSRVPDDPDSWWRAIKAAENASWMKDGHIQPEVKKGIQRILRRPRVALDRGGRFVPGEPAPRMHPDWIYDPRMRGFCNHSTRSHMHEDLHRYLFAAAFAKVRQRSPRLQEFPRSLLPDHRSAVRALVGNAFNDRFRVQLADRPACTITAHLNRDGHYFIHYDPAQCRSLTVREAARLQTFPDNYFFEGPRTRQYEQVGNAVPPLLARQIAEIVALLLR